MDILGAGTALILMLPTMLVIAVAIRLDDPGPVIYRQRRPGRWGRPFVILKYRTMVADADDRLRRDPALWQSFQDRAKLVHDPRVTRAGRLLRRFSLDELPQLWNVLRGDMSLVGPRPVTEYELEKLGPEAELLWSVAPGLTGLWQVSGRSSLTYQERMQIELAYIRHRSFWLDLSILARTIPAVFRGSGAY